jgi:hypothetical protein
MYVVTYYTRRYIIEGAITWVHMYRFVQSIFIFIMYTNCIRDYNIYIIAHIRGIRTLSSGLLRNVYTRMSGVVDLGKRRGSLIVSAGVDERAACLPLVLLAS